MTDYFCTPNGYGSKTGADWENAYAKSDFETSIEVTGPNADRYFCAPDKDWPSSAGESNEFDFSSSGALNFSANDGSQDGMLEIIGCVAGLSGTTKTEATGSDRPEFIMGTNDFVAGDYTWIRNIIIETSDVVGLDVNQYCVVQNVKIISSAASGRALYLRNRRNLAFDCEITCPNGNGIRAFEYTAILYCYIYNCGGDGLVIASNSVAACFNIFEDITDNGVELTVSSYTGMLFLHNVFDNCDDGIDVYTSSGGWWNINNQFTFNTGYGIKTSDTSNHKGIVHLYNNFFGNGSGDVDTTYLRDEDFGTADDPQYTNSEVDFSVGAAAAGFGMRLGVGA